jgi:hypothetical protein
MQEGCYGIVLLGVWSAIILYGCSGPPVEELMQAEAALQAAQAADAEDYAPEAFRAAAEAMADARSRNERKDYEGARTSALDAKVKAETARAGVEKGRMRKRQEAEQALAALQEEWALLHRAVEETSRRATDREKMDTARSAFDTAVMDINHLMETGDYIGALAAIKAASEKIAAVKELIAGGG